LTTSSFFLQVMALRVASLLSTTALAQQPSVDVAGLGTLNGLQNALGYDGVASFRGIPFAKSAAGALRWQPPEPYGAWESPRDATKYGNACIQLPGSTQPGIELSEDCLFLNVATPEVQLTSDKKLAVMLWIYGGADTLGDASAYPLDALVAGSDHQVVVAAMNYRLSVFGFAASADIQARSSDGSAGNFALQDQRLSMVWVRDHIGAFGGDGARVTIFGESAGGYNVMSHLALPASAGLFQRAIIESGTYNAGSQSLSDAEKEYTKMKKRVGCQDLACLLNTDAKELLPSLLHILEYPVVDGVAQKTSAELNIRKGQYQKNVDVLIGSNRDEMAFFLGPIFKLLLKKDNLTAVDLDLFLTPLILNPFKRAKAKKLYQPANYDYPKDLGIHNQEWWTAIRMGTDGGGIGKFQKDETGVFGLGHCGARHVARDLKAGGTAKVFQYLFDKGPIVGHSSEIPYVFGADKSFQDESDKKLARAMAKYWSSFAINGNPNSDGLPEWPEYDADTDMVMRLADNTHAEAKLRSEQCDFWQANPVHFDPAIFEILGPKMHAEDSSLIV